MAEVKTSENYTKDPTTGGVTYHLSDGSKITVSYRSSGEGGLEELVAVRETPEGISRDIKDYQKEI